LAALCANRARRRLRASENAAHHRIDRHIAVEQIALSAVDVYAGAEIACRDGKRVRLIR
jgi:hypothetical protein